MTDEDLQRLVMDVAATVRDAVEGVYQPRLEDAYDDLLILADIIAAHGDPELIEAARAVVASRQPARREWHHYCGTGARH